MQRLSLDINISIQDRCDKIHYYNRLGKELLATEPEQASGYFSQALTESLDIQNIELTADSYLLSGKALFKLGRIQDALVHYLSALSLAESHQFSKTEILYALYHTYKTAGDAENALKYHEEYHLTQKKEAQNKYGEDSRLFLRHVVHDIREPVRIVKSYQVIMARKLEQTNVQEYDEYLTYIETATSRIQALTDSFSQYVNIDTQPKQHTHIGLNEALHIAQYNLNNLLKDKVASIVQDNLPKVYGDFRQMTCLFEQLIENALKYNLSDAPLITIRVDRIEGYDRIAVEDNGIGINEKDLRKLLDIAYAPKRNSNAPESCGIGLIMCKKIIEKHQGNIWIESVPNQGTTVYFTLPLKR